MRARKHAHMNGGFAQDKNIEVPHPACDMRHCYIGIEQSRRLGRKEWKQGIDSERSSQIDDKEKINKSPQPAAIQNTNAIKGEAVIQQVTEF